MRCPTEMLPPLLLLTSLLIQTSGLPWYYNGDYGGGYGYNRAGGQYHEASNFYNPGNRAGLMESSPGGIPPRVIFNRAGLESSGLGGPECFISNCPTHGGTPPPPRPPAPPCDSWWCG